ncbi:exodeoxyribonuclease VII large subunit [Glycomyces salinus]|uniref:exodeoxyribonuclease VII large subunit n=1 Tax=Glycomyces salinus TaxID=980294 RepID=UPI0027DA23E0|nr:exodeoxyribonuclease VII large subunit [Glycomyces salinus]
MTDAAPRTGPDAPMSAENPWPLRVVSKKIGDWIARLGEVWTEGQITEISRRGRTVYLTLRDPSAEVSMRVVDFTGASAAAEPPLRDGAQVVVRAQPQWWDRNGSLSLHLREIRQVGLGELLARLERLKKLLAAEGLFAAERKKPLPFLPYRIGLVTGRASDAMRDVLKNAKVRLPAADFEVREVAVQGTRAVPEVCAALAELDADPDIEVIIIARGGGSMEDLLPFSDETLCRAVAEATTPVVSAIGHEPDTPILDYVADWRASTPTEAGKKVVPDLAEEQRGLNISRTRLRQTLLARLDKAAADIEAIRARPVLARPESMLDTRAEAVDNLVHRMRSRVQSRLERSIDDLEHLRARLRTLSPQSTLDRGYAIAQDAQSGAVLRDAADAGEHIRVRLAAGSLTAAVTEKEESLASRPSGRDSSQ